jgi:hypothetical protein
LPVQIIKESTLLIIAQVRNGEKGTNPLSDRLWNFGTAIFYKCGAKPWKTPPDSQARLVQPRWPDRRRYRRGLPGIREEGGVAFFSMSPFDAARYARLLEGLSVAEVSLSGLEFSGRLDAEYYQPEYLRAEDLIAARGAVPLSSVAEFLIGPFGSAFTVENYCDDPTYRYIRGKDVKPMSIVEDDNVYMPKADYDRLAKYALKAGDVLVSVVGTIGNSALVEPQHVPATDRTMRRLRVARTENFWRNCAAITARGTSFSLVLSERCRRHRSRSTPNSRSASSPFPLR